MGVHLAFDDALELAGEHFSADGSGVVRKEVPVQVGHFVLDHAGGKVVEGFRDLFQILIIVFHRNLLGADNVAVNARDAKAAFRIGYFFIALLHNDRIDEGAAEILEVVVHVRHHVSVHNHHPHALPYLGCGQAAAIGLGEGVFQILHQGGYAGLVGKVCIGRFLSEHFGAV